MEEMIIYAGRQFIADIIITSDDGATGVVLLPTDTGTITVTSSGPSGKCVIDKYPLTILDEANGIFTLDLPATETKKLTSYYGFKEDRYSTIGGYNGIMEFTLATGNRQALVNIDVIEVPECQITVP